MHQAKQHSLEGASSSTQSQHQQSEQTHLNYTTNRQIDFFFFFKPSASMNHCCCFYAAVIALLLSFVALSSEGQKPGICPAIVGGVPSQNPEHKCLDDYACPGSRKCCDTLIGRVCMLPERDSGADVQYNNPPSCPAVLPDSFTRDQHLCFSDADCRNGRRCCRYGSVKRCLGGAQYNQETTVWIKPNQVYPTTPRPYPYPPPRPPGMVCTGEGEVYSDCAPLCPKGCDNLHDKPTCSGCKPGCKCKKGYHRLEVNNDKSPCVENAVCRALTSNKNCPDGSVPPSMCQGRGGKCPPGTDCVNGMCCRQQQPYMPKPKPGECPSMPSPSEVKWAASCMNDNECDGSKKCCNTRNGRLCLSPSSRSGTVGQGNLEGTLDKVFNLLGLGNTLLG
ncbi:Caltrin-like protein [Trichinella pseudospiralis]